MNSVGQLWYNVVTVPNSAGTVQGEYRDSIGQFGDFAGKCRSV